METISLRVTRESDAPFLYRLMNEKPVRSALREPATSLADWEQAILAWSTDPDEEDYLVLENGVPVGWLGVNSLLSSQAYLKMVALLPSSQGQGIGRTAIKLLLDRLRSRGCASAALYTDCDNQTAQACYRSCGFSAVSDGSGRVRMERPL